MAVSAAGSKRVAAWTSLNSKTRSSGEKVASEESVSISTPVFLAGIRLTFSWNILIVTVNLPKSETRQEPFKTFVVLISVKVRPRPETRALSTLHRFKRLLCRVVIKMLVFTHTHTAAKLELSSARLHVLMPGGSVEYLGKHGDK